MTWLILAIVYLGMATGVFIQASAIERLGNVKLYSFVTPFFLMFLIVYLIARIDVRLALFAIANCSLAAMLMMQGIAYVKERKKKREDSKQNSRIIILNFCVDGLSANYA